MEGEDGTLSLLPDGSARSTLRGTEETGTWKEDGNAVTVTFGVENFSGTREGDRLNLSCVYDFVLSRNAEDKAQSEEVIQTKEEIPEEPAEQAGSEIVEEFSFEGDWYGYWVITEATGELEDSTGQTWDLCGTVALDEDGNGSFLLWDEDYSADNVLGALEVCAKEEELLVKSGFFGADELAENEWTFTRDSLGYDNLITASGSYVDGENGYSYTLYLRPWGQGWEDVAENERPRSYEKWYQPLIAKNKAMPDEIWKTK